MLEDVRRVRRGRAIAGFVLLVGLGAELAWSGGHNAAPGFLGGLALLALYGSVGIAMVEGYRWARVLAVVIAAIGGALSLLAVYWEYALLAGVHWQGDPNSFAALYLAGAYLVGSAVLLVVVLSMKNGPPADESDP